jgi:hypothetical protein
MPFFQNKEAQKKATFHAASLYGECARESSFFERMKDEG